MSARYLKRVWVPEPPARGGAALVHLGLLHFWLLVAILGGMLALLAVALLAALASG
jgi:hypothetical protein